MKILMFVSSLRNPFVEAWFDFLDKIGSDLAILASCDSIESPDLPLRCKERLVAIPNVVDWVREVEKSLGGQPDVLFFWWGFHLLADRRPLRAWPNAHASLCVDTFPNASRLTTEAREIVLAAIRSSEIDSALVTSTEMGKAVRQRALNSRVPIVVVPTPFLLASHSRTADSPAIALPLSMIFVGRSDMLFSQSRRMEKDDLGKWFIRLIEAGIQIVVQDPSSESLRNRLFDEGFGLYQPLDRDAVTDGRLATMIGKYHGQAAYYAVRRPTISRRVANGLSTRFATALCAPAPIVAPPQAKFARSLFESFRIGICDDDPGRIRQALESEQAAMRKNWTEYHEYWAGEQYVNSVRETWLGTPR